MDIAMNEQLRFRSGMGQMFRESVKMVNLGGIRIETTGCSS